MVATIYARYEDCVILDFVYRPIGADTISKDAIALVSLDEFCIARYRLYNQTTQSLHYPIALVLLEVP